MIEKTMWGINVQRYVADYQGDWNVVGNQEQMEFNEELEMYAHLFDSYEDWSNVRKTDEFGNYEYVAKSGKVKIVFKPYRIEVNRIILDSRAKIMKKLEKKHGSIKPIKQLRLQLGLDKE